MRIITVSREFGSGGREIGKRLADILGYDYYDREIISSIASIGNFHEKYVEEAGERGYTPGYTLTFGRTFYHPNSAWDNSNKMYIAEQKALKEIAQKGRDCIIVGRCADVVLAEYKPFNLFIHSDMASKIERCRQRDEEAKLMTDAKLEKKIKKVDKNRAKHREVISSIKWGDKSAYHLTVNTTDIIPKDVAPIIANYANSYFENKK